MPDVNTIFPTQSSKRSPRSQLAWFISYAGLIAFCRGAASATFDNSAIPSWGDVVWVYGPGTDPSMDTPQALENMIKHWKGRGFTGVYLRTDLAQLAPSMIRRNPPVKRDPRLAVIWNYIDEVSDS